MNVRVRLFAMQREAAGRRELRVDLPAGAVVEDAWAAAVREVPALAPGRSSVRFAVNGDYADATRALADGDELACIPPVSGGSGPRYRLTTSAASGRPARSRPVTPNSRRIARSWPTLVNAAAVAPQADAMSVARARRSSNVLPSPTSCMDRSMRRG